MRRGLSIETSGRSGSLALVEQGHVLVEEGFPHGLQHAARAVPMIDRLFRERGWTPADLDVIYVSVGPGSFTGLRIGVTLAKTLALATGAKLIAVPSLHAVVENLPAEARHAVVALDAKRGQVFAARFERVGEGWTERESPRLERLTEVVARAPRPLHVIGEGTSEHLATLSNGEREGLAAAPPELWQPRAATVARLGMKLEAANQFVDPFALVPLYVRKPEAEEKWEAGGLRSA